MEEEDKQQQGYSPVNDAHLKLHMSTKCQLCLLDYTVFISVSWYHRLDYCIVDRLL